MNRIMITPRAFLTTIYSVVLSACGIATSHLQAENVDPQIQLHQSPYSFDLRAPVQINGKELSFIVDTGCTFNLIDTSHKQLLKPIFRDVEIESIGGSHRSPLYTDNVLTISGTTRTNSDLLLVDLARMSNRFAQPIDGCVGMNVLRQLRFGYDGSHNSLYFGEVSHINNDHIESVLTWSKTQTPLTHDVDIDGIDDAFEIDTGADNGLSISPEIFTNLLQSGNIHSVHSSQSISTYGTHTYRSGRLSHARIWGIDFQDVPINDSSQPRIGMDILRKFDFYFDFPNDRLLLQTTDRTSEPFHYDRSGLRLSSFSNQIVVAKVSPSSPAARTGLMAGDTLLSVNARSVDRRDIDIITSQLDNPSIGKIDVRIRRGNQTYLGTILLNDYHKTKP